MDHHPPTSEDQVTEPGDEKLTAWELTAKLTNEFYRKKALEEGKPWPPPQIPRSQWPVKIFKLGETGDA